MHHRLGKAVKEKLFAAKHKWMQLSPTRFLDNYQHRIQNHRLQVMNLQDRLITVMDRLLAVNKFRFERNKEKVQNLGPLNVLSRGFSLVRKETGEVIVESDQCQEGEILEVLLAKGKLTVRVEGFASTWTEDDKSASLRKRL